MGKVITKRLAECTSIHESQVRFMPGRSTTDAIFVLKQTVEKHREGQKDFSFVFINLDKAYYHISREDVWRCPREQQVLETCIIVIQDMCLECEKGVRSNAGEISTSGRMLSDIRDQL